MTAPSNEDRCLEEAFRQLDPTPEDVERMELWIIGAYEAEMRSLAREWLDLFRVGPVLGASYTVAAAAGLAMATPFGTFLLSILLR